MAIYQMVNNYIGATVGCYANRIYKGMFSMEDGPHQLTVNNCETLTTVASAPISGSIRHPKSKNPLDDLYIVEFTLLDDRTLPNEFPGDSAVNLKCTH
ncbi:BFH_HP2_G0046970.mRNA.1.CDS.1 [Saccharomyces cerevisiae]|nr:BFH_HP2_G0046970.mRNA.1.CDS.1 [Saccharomyces cerevisiae]CAI6751141.1 BFH_HP2_G0046970.mRNA.1.CDS.1 [Saccharomyces cerevisiae]